MQQNEQYGSWISLISAEIVASKSIRFTGLDLQGETIYWSEQRPNEKGRTTILTSNGGIGVKELLPSKYSARTRVHEYGGVPLFVFDKDIFFISDNDQGIYKIDENNKISKVFVSKKCKFADLTIDHNSGLIFAVKEEIKKESLINSIVTINLQTKEEKEVVSGDDFYSNPKVSPNGKYLSYLSWNHPNMPWDHTSLILHKIEGKQIGERQVIAGQNPESIFQPEWSADNILYFISDRNGWWNLHRYLDNNINCIWQLQREFGLAQWVFGLSTYGFIDTNTIACVYFEKGKQQLGILKINENTWNKIDTPFHFFNYLKVNKTKIAFVGSSTILPASIAVYDVVGDKIRIVQSSQEISLDPDYISEGKFMEFLTVDNKKAYAYYYPPKNKNYTLIENQPPPLIVKCHGGPTGFSDNSLNLQVQYWTSRGFAYVDVNYGGSIGFGREYRQRLNGKWGIIDVQDCAKAVEHLVSQKMADPAIVIIKGGSAGGFTVLASLAFTKIYKAGVSYYGVSDLEMLANKTHKFEAHYLDNLIGPYPEKKEIYTKRSPINHIQNFSCPVLFFQGSEDKVVPPEQSEKMFLALKNKKIMTAYVLFDGEQHGFRKSESVKKSLESELYFYSRVFQFTVNDNIKPIDIEN